MEIDPLILVVVAGILGGLARTTLGYMGESPPGEAFSFTKLVKSLLRAVIGGGILGYWLALSPREVFFAAFLADVGIKDVWDLISSVKK